MFASIILVCAIPLSQCVTIANGIYPTQALCEVISEETIINNLERAERGEFPPHIALYRCIDFGQAL